MTHHFDLRRTVLVLVTFLCLLAHTSAAEKSIDSESPAAADDQASDSDLPAVAVDATKYDLRYKIETGDVLRFEVTHRASIRSTIDETTQAAQTKTDSTKIWKVSDVLPNGDIEFMNVVERVHMLNQLPDRDPIEYDSDRDTTPPPGFEDAAKSVGVPLSVVRMTPRGKIVRRDAKLRNLQSEEDAPIVVRLPEEPVAIGATWDEPFEVKVEQTNGTTKLIETRRHHQLATVENGIATIKVTYQVLSPVDAPEEAQLIQRMMNGEVRFVIVTGRLLGQRMEIDKKILGFAGPTSSLQYLMRMEEKAVEALPKKVADKLTNSATKAPSTNRVGKAANDPEAKLPSKSAAIAPAEMPASQPRQAARPNRAAKRSRTVPQGARGYTR